MLVLNFDILAKIIAVTAGLEKSRKHDSRLHRHSQMVFPPLPNGFSTAPKWSFHRSQMVFPPLPNGLSTFSRPGLQTDVRTDKIEPTVNKRPLYRNKDKTGIMRVLGILSQNIKVGSYANVY